MSLFNKPLGSIGEADLRALIDDKVRESKTIEYKQSLPTNADSEKKEFLADVSSFANASGGHLVFGIVEASGLPLDLCGLEIEDLDAEIRRLENIIRDGIEPRIPGLQTFPVPISGGKAAIIIWIPRSWALPHMVTYQGQSRFYSRNSAGKYPLDVSELRALFSLSETATERIRKFRIERLTKIIAGETPAPLLNSAKIVLHLIPFSAFDPSIKFDLSSFHSKLDKLLPICHRGGSYRYNFEGFLTFTNTPERNIVFTYLQIFRNGCIEAAEQSILKEEGTFIKSLLFEKEMIESLGRFFSIQKEMGVEPPVCIMLSLLGVKGYKMMPYARWLYETESPIDRDDLILPEAIAESYEVNPADLLRPIFDSIWNACGLSRALTYDENGIRKV